MSAARASSACVTSRSLRSSLSVTSWIWASAREVTRATAWGASRPAFTDFHGRVLNVTPPKAPRLQPAVRLSAQGRALHGGQSPGEKRTPHLLGAANRVPVVASIQPLTQDEEGRLTLHVHAVQETKRGRRRATRELAKSKRMGRQVGDLEPRRIERVEKPPAYLGARVLRPHSRRESERISGELQRPANARVRGAPDVLDGVERTVRFPRPESSQPGSEARRLELLEDLLRVVAEASPGFEVPGERVGRQEAGHVRMLVPEERLAAPWRGLGRAESLDHVERSGDVLGRGVVERREPFGEHVGGQELHVRSMHRKTYAGKCITRGARAEAPASWT